MRLNGINACYDLMTGCLAQIPPAMKNIYKSRPNACFSGDWICNKAAPERTEGASIGRRRNGRRFRRHNASHMRSRIGACRAAEEKQ